MEDAIWQLIEEESKGIGRAAGAGLIADETDDRVSINATKRLILGGTAVAITIAMWQALWSAGKISPLFLSGPSAIAKQFGYGLLHGTLLADMRYSGTNFAIGFALALVAGVVAGRDHRLVPNACG